MSENLICPRCGSREIARIEYGLPAFNEKFERDLEAGRIVLGGCLVSENDPQWKCLGCENKWDDDDATESDETEKE